MTATHRLERRVADLDSWAGDPALVHPDGDLAQFIWVMQQVAGEPGDRATKTLRAEDADELLRRCSLLDRLATHFPQLTDGPLDKCAQHWVATGRPPWQSRQNHVPQESSFIPVARASRRPTGAKPFYVGLFTSTSLAGGHGMWRSYLRGYEGSSSLHIKPWYTWHLQPRNEVRVYEIRDATHWVKLITAHPRIEGGFVHPDWPTIADRWDAVHITLRAIAAAQGFSFATALGPTTAPYWDLESTFWLSWCFTTATLVKVEPSPQDTIPSAAD